HVTEEPFIKPEILDFGSTALLIKDLTEFISRIKKRLKELEIAFKCGHVNYYEESGVNDNLTVFDKPNKFKHQHEFRILIADDSPTPFSFCIGPIEDISVVLATEELLELKIARE